MMNRGLDSSLLSYFFFVKYRRGGHLRESERSGDIWRIKGVCSYLRDIRYNADVLSHSSPFRRRKLFKLKRRNVWIDFQEVSNRRLQENIVNKRYKLQRGRQSLVNENAYRSMYDQSDLCPFTRLQLKSRRRPISIASNKPLK